MHAIEEFIRILFHFSLKCEVFAKGTDITIEDNSILGNLSLHVIGSSRFSFDGKDVDFLRLHPTSSRGDGARTHSVVDRDGWDARYFLGETESSVESTGGFVIRCNQV